MMIDKYYDKIKDELKKNNAVGKINSNNVYF